MVSVFVLSLEICELKLFAILVLQFCTKTYKNNLGFVQSVFPRLTLFHQGEQREPQSGGAAKIRQKLMFSEIISQAFNQKLTHLQIQSPVPKFDHSCLVRLSLKFILLVD